jgi:hypothetical protein
MRARTAMNKRDVALFAFREFPIVLDPVYNLYLDAHQKGASNRNNYDNPEFDKLVDAAQVEADPAKPPRARAPGKQAACRRCDLGLHGLSRAFRGDAEVHDRVCMVSGLSRALEGSRVQVRAG